MAGLTISKTNSGPGSSDRIIFRGNRSITGDNQPLIIVDGARIDNTPQAFADVTNVGARDNADGISNINPDDIESMTVLTGASAAALYGNGAIIITTKKETVAKGVGIQVASSFTTENPLILPDYEYQTNSQAVHAAISLLNGPDKADTHYGGINSLGISLVNNNVCVKYHRMK